MRARQGMAFDAAAFALRMSHYLPFGGVESVSKGDVRIFVGITVDHDFISGDEYVNTHVESVALVLVVVRLFDCHRAARDVGM